MNKIIVIGDIHGRTIWEDIVKENIDADKIIFLGDYMDPYINENIDISYESMKRNLLNIIKLKKENIDKVILLLGNHDTHYIFGFQSCSRYDFKYSKKIKKLFEDNIDLFQLSYQIDNNLFSHAGITQKWFDWSKKYLEENGLNEDLSNLSEVLNSISDTKSNYIDSISYMRGGGDLHGSLIWADINEFFKSETEILSLKGFHQYVGHNKVNYLYRAGDDNTSITFCDVLHKPNINMNYNYLKLENKI